MANSTLFRPASSVAVAPVDTVNPAGGQAYAYGPEHALAQVAATGTFADGFYGKAEDQLTAIVELSAKVSDTYLAKMAVYARERACMKDMPAALLLILSKRSAALFHAVFPRVIDNGRTLRTFFQMLRSGQFGRKSMSYSIQRAVQNWLNNASVGSLLSGSIGDKPSLRDVLRMARPTPKDDERRALFGWLTQKPLEKWAPATQENLPFLVQALEEYRNAETDEYQALVLDRVREKSTGFIRWDLLSDAAKGKKAWAAIAKTMGEQALRMNLNTLHRHGVLEDPGAVADIAARIADEAGVRKSRQFPYQYFAAYMNAEAEVPQKIRQALGKAAEIACGNIPELPGPVVIGVDVSGSMSSAVTGNRGAGATSKMRCVDVAALVAAALFRRNPDSLLVPFDGNIHDCQMDPGDTILSLAQRLAAFGGGSTDCHLPLLAANMRQEKAFAGCVIISDNCSWVSAGHRGTPTMHEFAAFADNQKRLKRFPKPKLICIDLQHYGSTQAPDAETVLNIGGFSDAVFGVVSAFLSDNRNRFVSEVEAVKID